MEYAMAVKRFVHKTGRPPTSLEQLEDTNHVRFLRKRFKDPMTVDGEWRLIHPGEAQINFPTAATNPGLQGGGNTGQPVAGVIGQQGGNLGQPGGLSQPGGLGQSGGGDPGQPGGSNRGQGQLGSLAIQNIGNGQPTGGGFIIGVASTSKATSIKEYNTQTTYDGWLFVYEQRLEQTGGTGIVIAAPTGNATPAVAAPTNPAAGATATPAPSSIPQ